MRKFLLIPLKFNGKIIFYDTSQISTIARSSMTRIILQLTHHKIDFWLNNCFNSSLITHGKHVNLTHLVSNFRADKAVLCSITCETFLSILRSCTQRFTTWFNLIFTQMENDKHLNDSCARKRERKRWTCCMYLGIKPLNVWVNGLKL